MKVYKEVNSIFDFEFWSGAKDTVKYLSDSEVNTVLSILDDCYSDGMSETELNDFFWFEDDTIAEWLGWSDFETIMEARSGGNSFDTEREYEEWLEEQETEEDENA